MRRPRPFAEGRDGCKGNDGCRCAYSIGFIVGNTNGLYKSFASLAKSATCKGSAVYPLWVYADFAG